MHIGGKITILTWLICGLHVADAEQSRPDSATAQAYNNAAKSLAGDNPMLLWPYKRFCVTGYRIAKPDDHTDALNKPTDFLTPKGFISPTALRSSPTVEPVQVFDNIYFAGNRVIGSFIVKTTAGLVIIDTMNDSKDVNNIIVPAFHKFGLDPRDIKYIIVTHQHADHYGGVNRLLEMAASARVVMGGPDADELEKKKASGLQQTDYEGKPLKPEAAKAALDIIPTRIDIRVANAPNSVNGVADITLGATTIRMALVPSHTIGMLSLIVPTTWKGEPHVVAIWGGNHIDSPNLPEKARQYTSSLDYFHSLTTLAGADAALHPHSYQIDEADLFEEMRLHPDAPNPFVLGRAGYDRYISIWTECMRALGQRAEDGTWLRF